jgi:hypothetical protein
MSAFFGRSLEIDGYNFTINPVFEIQLKKDWNIELFGNYVGRAYIAQFITDPYWFADITLSKKLSEKSCQVP